MGKKLNIPDITTTSNPMVERAMSRFFGVAKSAEKPRAFTTPAKAIKYIDRIIKQIDAGNIALARDMANNFCDCCEETIKLRNTRPSLSTEWLDKLDGISWYEMNPFVCEKLRREHLGKNQAAKNRLLEIKSDLLQFQKTMRSRKKAEKIKASGTTLQDSKEIFAAPEKEKSARKRKPARAPRAEKTSPPRSKGSARAHEGAHGRLNEARERMRLEGNIGPEKARIEIPRFRY